VSAAMTAFRTGLNATSIGGATVSMVGISYWTRPSPDVPKAPSVLRPTPLVNPVVAERCGPRIDTQRRRLGREPIH
jgi:hypothetical protein